MSWSDDAAGSPPEPHRPPLDVRKPSDARIFEEMVVSQIWDFLEGSGWKVLKQAEERVPVDLAGIAPSGKPFLVEIKPTGPSLADVARLTVAREMFGYKGERGELVTLLVTSPPVAGAVKKAAHDHGITLIEASSNLPGFFIRTALERLGAIEPGQLG